MKNVSMKVKMAVLVIPLIVALILSSLFYSSKMRQISRDSEELYFEKLYKVTSDVLNADRDLYQAMMGATMYFDVANGYSTLPANEIESMKELKFKEYEENCQQAKERVSEAIEIAKTNEDLYKNTRRTSIKCLSALCSVEPLWYNLRESKSKWRKIDGNRPE